MTLLSSDGGAPFRYLVFARWSCSWPMPECLWIRLEQTGHFRMCGQSGLRSSSETKQWRERREPGLGFGLPSFLLECTKLALTQPPEVSHLIGWLLIWASGSPQRFQR